MKSNMGKVNNKVLLGVAILAIIIVLIVIFVVGLGKKEEQPTQQNTLQGSEALLNSEDEALSTTRPTIEGTDYVSEQDGIKVNTSSKLLEEKKFEIFTFSNIRIETDAEGSAIIADVTANSTEKTEGKIITINILDVDGKVVSTLGGYIGQIKPGETNTFRAETTTDITNAYDFEIKGE